MPFSHLPPLLTSTFSCLASWLHKSSALRLPQLLLGVLIASGRRTVTSWFRAAYHRRLPPCLAGATVHSPRRFAETAPRTQPFLPHQNGAVLGNTFGTSVGGQFEPISFGISCFRCRIMQADVLPRFEPCHVLRIRTSLRHCSVRCCREKYRRLYPAGPRSGKCVSRRSAYWSWPLESGDRLRSTTRLATRQILYMD
jgi:hypothetical protein